MNKLLIICGPTATGKTSIGIALAKKFNGEIVSADSRQVYKDLDIITGKDIEKKSTLENKNSELDIQKSHLSVGFRKKDGIPIWLVDVVETDYIFNVGEYKQIAGKVIRNIQKRGKVPIVVGGTGLYIRALREPLSFMDIPPNDEEREKLNKMSLKKLTAELKRIDPIKLKNMNRSDSQNPRRLIRAIEIAAYQKSHPDINIEGEDGIEKKSIAEILMIGLTTGFQEIEKKIDKRIQERIQEGAEIEAESVFAKKMKPNLPAITTTGLKQLREYKEGRLSREEAIELWKREELKYAKRQMTWFKKEREITWFDISQKEYDLKIEDIVSKWYTP